MILISSLNFSLSIFFYILFCSFYYSMIVFLDNKFPIKDSFLLYAVTFRSRFRVGWDKPNMLKRRFFWLPVIIMDCLRCGIFPPIFFNLFYSSSHTSASVFRLSYSLISLGRALYGSFKVFPFLPLLKKLIFL